MTSDGTDPLLRRGRLGPGSAHLLRAGLGHHRPPDRPTARKPVLWVGTSDEQARTIEELRAALGQFAPLLDEDELELEIERALKEGIVDEDEFDKVLDDEPTREQIRGYLFRREYRRTREVASLERARIRHDAAQHTPARRAGFLRLFRRAAD